MTRDVAQTLMSVPMALRAAKWDENPRADVAQALVLAAPRLFGALGEVRTSFRPARRVFDRAASTLLSTLFEVPETLRRRTCLHARKAPRRVLLRSAQAPRQARVLAPLAFLLTAACAFGQPGQPAPMQPSMSMQDSNLRPALPRALEGIGIDQKLDAQIPLDLTFRDEFGRSVPLSTYFHSGKPVILALVYYRCPMLCTQILNGLESSLKAVSLTPGQDFEVLSVSFDPKDTWELAASKKQMYLKRYGRPDTANGWHFMTGDEANIKALTAAVGFHYRYDPKTDQFAHASGIQVLTPDGHLARYFYGVEYAPRDVRLGLVEASQNKIGTPVDQILLFCYHYDPGTGKYGAIAMNMVRFAGGTFVLIGATFLLFAFRREVKAGKQHVSRAG